MVSSILASDKLPDEEKDLARLADEMEVVVFAGTDTPSQVMAITLFHILWNPEVHQKLKAELAGAFPIASDANWNKIFRNIFLMW